LVQGKGVNVFNLTVPTAPRLRVAANTGQFGWKQIAANGSGLGVAAVSPNQAFDGQHNLSLYDLSVPESPPGFITEFVTPGIARAVTIYNGLAYVADGTAGLQVINYRAYDRNGIAPSIRLATSFAAGVAEEGKLMRLTADVGDDVQVRHVKFYLDGQELATDGNFPFEVRFFTPLIQEGKTSFQVRALATDTGGNATWSDELTLNLVPDATPPRVTRSVPFNGALLGAPTAAALFFSEPLDSATILSENFSLTQAGADGLFGTADDGRVNFELEIREGQNAVFLSFPVRLTAGSYRLTAATGLQDRAGNPISVPFAAQFRVFSFVDLDGDGVPDELESSLGLDPTNPDTNGDGVPDGLEDPDRDGLSTAWEILATTDPLKPDSDGNGVSDGDEDPDGDGLSNRREAAAGTLPLEADSDVDGWNDESEVTGGSDPLNPASLPPLFLRGAPRVAVQRSGYGPGGANANGFFLSRPPVSVGWSGLEAGGALARGLFVGRPSVSVNRTTLESGALALGSYVGRPPVSVGLTALGANTGLTLGRPPVSVTRPTQ